MLFIFKDERRGAGLSSSNPVRTSRILLVDSVAKCLKWSALRRILRLATDKIWNASTVTLIENTP